ncbi:MAG: PTS sugar transporter subunit IIC, partial [Clostridia bacterium]|nr:PTS sugar transporter subunit IIC [Clostridia bacterium]
MDEQNLENNTEPKKENRFKSFLKRKDIVITPKRYGIDAMGSMALGLFGSLLIGTIFKAIGLIPFLSVFAQIGGYAQAVAGPAMAVAIAYALKAPPLVLFSASAVGYAANTLGGAGGPLAVLVIAIIATELGKMVSKETKVDIIVTPFVTVLAGGLLSVLIAPPIGTLVGYLSKFIGWATTQQPFVMGIIVSVVIGIALTLPISSAAICSAINLSGVAIYSAGELVAMDYEGLALAGGAAVAGCCAQMVGFAVMSFKENRWSGLLSQGIGTSMIQMPNIVRKHLIWIPPIVASAITGPLATCVFQMRMYGAAINSGMGTCGLLGPIGTILGWFGGEYPDTVTALDWTGLVLICFVLPAVISLGVAALMR